MTFYKSQIKCLNPNYAIEANEISELLALVGLTPI